MLERKVSFRLEVNTLVSLREELPAFNLRESNFCFDIRQQLYV